jgi:hypothetical protein
LSCDHTWTKIVHAWFSLLTIFIYYSFHRD